MRYATVLFAVLFVLSHAVQAQNGNEWIKFNQQYFKIAVATDGIHRLTAGDLQSAGFPVASVDPRRIQIFHRGIEEAIYIQGESDAHFDPADFIEFYGQRNDGTLDKEIYKPVSAQPHNYYNIYNDTTAYFLTVNAGAVLGKRMDLFSEVNTGLPKEVSHTSRELLIAHDAYAFGEAFNTYVFSAYNDVGEGWTGVQIKQGESQTYGFQNIVNTKPSAGTPQLQVLLVGRYSIPHKAEIYIGPNTAGLRLLSTQSFSNYNTSLLDLPIQWTDIGGDGKMTLRVSVVGAGGGTDFLSLSYARITFPQALDDGNQTAKNFYLNPNAGGKSYVEITNYNSGSRLFDVTNTDSPRRIGVASTSTLNAVVDQASSSRHLYLTSQPLTTAVIKPITFRQIDPANRDYVIISHSQLMKPAGGYSDVVKAYATYRHSAAGGGYDTLVVDIQQLYDQFSYGEETPVAIVHFMKYLADVHLPKYLFIIGKGLEPEYDYFRKPSSFTTHRNLVPSIGYPASDSYFTAGLSGTTYEPAVPTGRISADTPQEVAAYFNKVKETESLPFQQSWRKNILHLSGGINAGEPERFEGYLQGFAQIAEGYYFGGEVKAIAKQNTGIDFININDEVNKGLDLVTFFGHSSPSTIDFDIGFATDPQLGYNNKGKYPVFLMNGCNIGSFFLNTTIFGEDWVDAADKGAIAFVAHSSYGLEGLLRFYSELFYEVGYADPAFIGKGLGDIQKEVARRFIAQTSASAPNIAQVQEMVLLGDPAVKLFGADKPDYAVDDQGVSVESFDEEPVTALSDSLDLRIAVNNFGVSTPDSLVVKVTRSMEGGGSFVYQRTFAPVLNTDTLSFTIYKEGGVDAYGTNTFDIALDPLDSVEELSELNNTASYDFFVPLSRTKTLFPTAYAIVSTMHPSLVFQSTDPFSAARDYVLELDTVNTFDSPFMQASAVNTKVLGSLSADLLSGDSVAYYWRVRYADPNPGESADWSESSFTYINGGVEGWAQVHFPQYENNKLAGLVSDSIARALKFKQTVTTISVHTFGADNPAINTDVSVRLNDTEYNLSIQAQPCRDNTLNLIAFDKTTTTPYIKGLDLGFDDPRSCGRIPKVIASFTPGEFESGDGKNLINYIDNVTEADSVVLFSIGDAGYSTWSSTAIAKLGELGISGAEISALTDGEPVVIFTRKGAPSGTATFFLSTGAPPEEQELLVDGTITGKYTSGTMTSVLIGPASNWHKLYEKVKISETPITDTYAFDVYGVSLSGASTLVRTDAVDTVSLSSVFPDDYPYVNIVFKPADNVNLTPPQLRNWIVTYASVAEGLALFEGPTDKRTLQEGESWSGRFGFVNISQKTFKDSLSVAIAVHNQDTKVTASQTLIVDAPLPGDTAWFNVEVDTHGKAGLNDLTVFVNPRVQPEQYYDNNIITLNSYLDILPDTSNPVLDVTVDGRHLQNGDFVSPDPRILIRVWDENAFLKKIDTTGVTVFLRYPCDSIDCPFVPVYFSRPEVSWSPATADNDFTMTFMPADLPEGTYTLRASAQDASGNGSGSDPFEVSFQVKYNATLVMNPPHPNPSSGNVTFGLTISGIVVPDYVSVDIINTTGRLINTFSTDQLHIGFNELFWDGTDFGGQRLGAGLYIFRMRVMSNGKALSLQTPEGVKGVRNGIGKIVLK